MRISAVASSSAGISYLQVWVDGVKAGPTEHYSRHREHEDFGAITSNLANGTHKITVVAKQGTALAKSTHTVKWSAHSIRLSL